MGYCACPSQRKKALAALELAFSTKSKSLHCLQDSIDAAKARAATLQKQLQADAHAAYVTEQYDPSRDLHIAVCTGFLTVGTRSELAWRATEF